MQPVKLCEDVLKLQSVADKKVTIISTATFCHLFHINDSNSTLQSEEPWAYTDFCIVTQSMIHI